MTFGDNLYIVVNAGKVVEKIRASCARDAVKKKTQEGALFLLVGGESYA